jgi:PQQ-dependent catabolism-associated CXXCW motif protein
MTSMTGLTIGRLLIAGVLVSGPIWAAPPWQQAPLAAAAYDNETQDFGVPAANTIRTGNYEAPTPTRIGGAAVITTPRLRDMMLAPKRPILIDVLGGNPTMSLPGAIWLRGAGLGTGFGDEVQQRLAARLMELTGGDKSRAMVFFCLSRTCWLSYNAALRAVSLGYRNVMWYRGGRNAWIAAGLTMEPLMNF